MSSSSISISIAVVVVIVLEDNETTHCTIQPRGGTGGGGGSSSHRAIEDATLTYISHLCLCNGLYITTS